MIIRISREAGADLVRLRAFLAEKNPSAAARAGRLLVDAIQSLDRFPSRGRPVGTRNIREIIVPFGRSAYIIRYAETADREIVVLRVWHAREMRD